MLVSKRKVLLKIFGEPFEIQRHEIRKIVHGDKFQRMKNFCFFSPNTFLQGMSEKLGKIKPDFG